MPIIAKAKDHFGHKRTTSEDIYRIHDDLGLYLVADGSRDKDGLWAAETACEVIRSTIADQKALLDDYAKEPTRTKRLKIEDLLDRAIQEACAAVRVPATEGRRAHTTTALQALLMLPDYAISAHVGNTRLYLVSDPEPIQLTHDHTVYEEMARGRRAAADKVNPQLKRQLTRALGPHSMVPVDVFPIPLSPGAAFLLCSNGLSDTFEAGTMTLKALRDAGSIEQLQLRLVEHALSKGSDDNITALVVRMEGAQAATGKTTALDVRKQLEILKRLDVLQAIRGDLPSLFSILSLFDYRRAAANATIVQEGAPGDEMYILLSGKADVVVSGKKVDKRGPGDAFGEMAFFTKELRSATVIATEACVLMSLHRSDFDALVEKDPLLGYRISQGVVAELSRKLKNQSGNFATLGAAGPPANPVPGKK